MPHTTMRSTHTYIFGLLLLWIFLGGSLVRPQRPKGGTYRSEGASQELAGGQQIFQAHCAACHGLDGSGTQRAPNIGAGSKTERLSSADVLRVVSDGIPGTGMPSFRVLGDAKVNAVVAYVKTLEGVNHSVPLPGNPVQGKQLFFGSAGCSTCHAIGGQGGFIGPDLSTYAQAHSVDRIEAAIKDPTQRDSKVVVVNVITGDGQAYRGVVRNEDNFSIQLQSMDGSFHFIRKSDLKRMDREPSSMMPSDYGSKLSRTQLNDLISYLLKASGESQSVAVKNDDE
jgi:cytochrome c oxidase cbb3-type subunit III